MATDPDLKQDDFRWAMLLQLVAKAEEIEKGVVADRTRSERSRPAPSTPISVGRWSGGAKYHHHDTVVDYVTPAEAEQNQKIVDANPGTSKSNKNMRKRDRRRQDGKVRNPLFTSASRCIVCKFVHQRTTWTTKFCRECTPGLGWPQTNRVTGFRRLSHPRLCSSDCFTYFHTHRIPGLDYGVKKSRRAKRSQHTPADDAHNVRTR